MPKSHLISEQRLDKNNRLVTRWVRGDGSGKPDRRVIPVVKATGRSLTLRDSLIASLSDAIDSGAYEDTDLPSKDELFVHIDKLSDDTIAAWVSAFDDDPDPALPDHFLGVLTNRDTDRDARYLLEIIRLDPQREPGWSDGAEGTYTYQSSVQIMAGLHYGYTSCGYVPPQDISDEDSLAVRQTKALITAVHRGLETETNASWSYEEGLLATLVRCPPAGTLADAFLLRHEPMIRLVLEMPERAQEIIDTAVALNDPTGERVRVALQDGIGKNLYSGIL